MNFSRSFTMKDFRKARYLSLVKAYPLFKKERSQLYLLFSLTFLSLSLLGIFAFNPTITTIVELRKKLADSKFANERLKTKINNLSSLHAQYEALTNVWPVVNAAVPDEPKAAYVMGQVQAIAKATNVSIADLEVFQIELTKKTTPLQKQKYSSFTYSVTVSGSTEDQMTFLKTLSQFDRTISIESVTFSNDEKQLLTVVVRTYFIP